MVDKPDCKRLHPKVEEALDLVDRGRMNRREFVRVAALLGVAAPVAYKMAGLKSALAAGRGTMPFPDDDPAAKTGGILRVGMQVQKMEDPATFSWTQMSNQSRHMLEYLTMTGPDNITRPMLAESWSASDDLKTWTLNIRKGVMFHNGDELNADHVIWNVERWLVPELGSSITGLATFAAMVEEHETGEKDDDGNPKKVQKIIPGAVEKVDDHTVRFNLSKPVLAVAEECYHYPAAITHPSFTAPINENPIGTGAYRLAELVVGERAILKRVTKTDDGKDFVYWGGKTYLDEIHYYSFDAENQLTAFASGEVDGIYAFDVEQMELAKALEGEIIPARTAQTLVCRFQISQKPYDNLKLRQAFMHALDTTVYRDLVFLGAGDEAEHHHVAPIHPEYFPLPKITRDVEKAKALLAEAGYADGVEMTIDVGNTDGPWHQTTCEIMRDQLAEVGIKLNINVMPASTFWEIWDKTAFGATAWTHRPLGVMVLGLAYRSSAVWNETHYRSDEFDAALDDASATLDVAERKAKMENVEKLLQDAAVIMQPLWRPVYTIASKKVKGWPAHPTQHHQFNKLWMDA